MRRHTSISKHSLRLFVLLDSAIYPLFNLSARRFGGNRVNTDDDLNLHVQSREAYASDDYE